jgi:MazG family protein
MSALAWVIQGQIAILGCEDPCDWNLLQREGMCAAVLCCDHFLSGIPDGFDTFQLHPAHLEKGDLGDLLSFLRQTALVKKPLVFFSDRSLAWSGTLAGLVLMIGGKTADEAATIVGKVCPTCRREDMTTALQRLISPLQRILPEEAVRFTELASIMRVLRQRCPWDREQTHQSLTKYLLEESWELADAVRREDPQALCGELGDVLLQVIFHAVIAEEEGHFTLSQAAEGISRKLLRRHPHVFCEHRELSPRGVERQWETIKDKQENRSRQDQDRRYMPALIRAERIQEVAAHDGFDWQNGGGVLEKIREELTELQEAVRSGQSQAILEEIGDMLFTLVNLCRLRQVNPEEALHLATDKFLSRYRLALAIASDEGMKSEEMTLEELDRVWEKAKNQLQPR